jgi:hypothetical protein
VSVFLVKDLPPILQSALKEWGWTKRDIPLVTVEPDGRVGMGRGSMARLVYLDTGLMSHNLHGKSDYAYEGGFEGTDRDTGLTETHILPGQALVYQAYGGRYQRILVYLHGPDLDQLEEGNAHGKGAASLTERQKAILAIFAHRKPAYRGDEMHRLHLGEYSATNPEIAALISLGMVAVNKAGALSLTTKGKNHKGDRVPFDAFHVEQEP